MPASTGLGVTLAAVIFGGFGSYLTVLVMVVVLPALSFATILIVFVPADNMTVVLNAPLLLTVTAAPLTVTVTGDEVASLVVPDTVIVLLLVTYPSDGEVTKTSETISRNQKSMNGTISNQHGRNTKTDIWLKAMKMKGATFRCSLQKTWKNTFQKLLDTLTDRLKTGMSEL